MTPRIGLAALATVLTLMLPGCEDHAIAGDLCGEAVATLKQ